MKPRRILPSLWLLITIWVAGAVGTLGQSFEVTHREAEYTKLNLRVGNLSVQMGPPRIVVGDTSIKGRILKVDLRNPPPLYFDRLFDYLRSDTIKLVAGTATLSFAWNFYSIDLDNFLRPDSSLRIIYEVFDVDSGQVILRVLETDIRRGFSQLMDSISGQKVSGFLASGTRKQIFEARYGQRIFTRMRINTSALVDSSLLKYGMAEVGHSFVDSADYLSRFPPGLPYLVTNTLTEIKKSASNTLKYSLEQCSPNPFNPSTKIRFTLPDQSIVRLLVFNALGQKVAELANEEMSPGMYERIWNTQLASGIYFYRLEAVSTSDPTKRFVESKKMILLK